MKQPLKMHRPSSVAAAVFMVLSLMLTIAAFRSASVAYPGIYLIEFVGNAVITVLLSVILFRGRKDTAAGVVFLIAGILPVLSAAYDLLPVALNAELSFYFSLCACSGMALAAFRLLAAWECLDEGRISAGGGRMLLRWLPVLCFCVEVWAQMLLCIADGMNIGNAVIDSLIYMIPQWLGPILMGISLSVREKREDC